MKRIIGWTDSSGVNRPVLLKAFGVPSWEPIFIRGNDIVGKE
jgi:hypothetical protein